MKSAFEKLNQRLVHSFIKNADDVLDQRIRIRHGFLAGWISISAILIIFSIKLFLGLKSGSISIVVNAFHLLSHLANSVVLIISFHVSARPATAKNPFGYGRMEHVAPLIMSIFLFVSGIQLSESSLHQVTEPHSVHLFPGLIWILLATIFIKQMLYQFIKYLGNRVESHAILTNAAHQSIEAIMSFAVILGLIAGDKLHRPELDGYLGLLVSLWLLYMGYTHAKEALIPILGKAPQSQMIQDIRKTVKSVPGVEGVHEIIVHDYGSLYTLSMHVEIPERYGPQEMHEIAEKCEAQLRTIYRGEVICHTDPLMEKTPEVIKVETKFSKIVKEFPEIVSYHDFRIIAHSKTKILIIADLNIQEEFPDNKRIEIPKKLESRVLEVFPEVAYCSFYLIPKFAY